MKRSTSLSVGPWLGSLLAAAAALLLPATALAGAGEPLTLRINDTVAVPGGEVAVVLRTYASRPIRQGQLCLHAASAGLAPGSSIPLAQLERVVIFSPEGDVLSQSSFTVPTQTVEVEFSSVSAGINSVDGPMVALYFRLDSAVLPGQLFTLDLDPAQTFLIDAIGQPVPIEIRPGEMQIKAPGEPSALGIDGTEVVPGNAAEIGVETDELFPIAAGQVGVSYDPAVVAGAPTVAIDERFGMAEVGIVDSGPGLLIVRFHSPDASLNSLPGTFLSISLPTDPSVSDGTLSPVALEPALTVLESPSGAEVPLELSGDSIVFTAGSFFADGFESGTLDGWDKLSTP